jgi:Lrp/AsnC family transcriptional regulator, leucine-responsive regulatory protein
MESLNDTGWRILQALQRNARMSSAELARAVNMSPSAVTERMRRLEESGVVIGYTAVLDPERVGLGILAFVRLRYPSGNYRPFHTLLDTSPEIIEAHHVTGEDCFILKVLARSMRQLEEVVGRISGLGSVTTSVVYSSPLMRRALTAPSCRTALEAGQVGVSGRGGATQILGQPAGRCRLGPAPGR